jgi:hypothetical protein
MSVVRVEDIAGGVRDNADGWVRVESHSSNQQRQE